MNWLGDAFDEDELLAVLEVAIPAGMRTASIVFETLLFDVIPPSVIRLISTNYGVGSAASAAIVA